MEISQEKRKQYKREYGEPLCFFCGGNMQVMVSKEGELIKNERDAEGYQCPDCEAVLWRGYPMSIVMRNISVEMRGRERGMIKKKGGGGNRSRQRKKKPVYRSRYPDY